MVHSHTQNWKNFIVYRKSEKKNIFFSRKSLHVTLGHSSDFSKISVGIPFFCFFPLYMFFFCKSDSLTKFQFLLQIDRFFHGHYQLSCLNITIYMHNFLFKTRFEWFRKICTCFSFFSWIIQIATFFWLIAWICLISRTFLLISWLFHDGW